MLSRSQKRDGLLTRDLRLYILEIFRIYNANLQNPVDITKIIIVYFIDNQIDVNELTEILKTEGIVLPEHFYQLVFCSQFLL